MAFSEEDRQLLIRVDERVRNLRLNLVETNKKVDVLWDKRNKQEGAFSAGRMIAGGIGGVFVAAVDFISKGGH